MLHIDNEVFKRMIISMLLRLNWLFMLFIYLSVNGQVFATAVHLCPQMALSSSTLSTSQNIVNIHEHHQKIELNDHNAKQKVIDDMLASKTMNNCQCVDCDCVQNISGQANTSLVQNTNLIDYLPVSTLVLSKFNQDFISQPQTNPYRPPIVI